MSKYNVTAKREIHGMVGTPTYYSWYCAKTRALNPRATHAKYYTNVTMCEQWQKSFTTFLADMGVRPPGTTLDRKDNSKGYEPGNCRWATKKEQANNRRVRKEYYRDIEGKFTNKLQGAN